TRFPLPVSASGIGHIPHLRRRLTMIMQANTPRSLSAAGWLLLGLAAFLLPVAARAQTPDKGHERDRAIKALKDQLRAWEEQSRDKKVQLDNVVDVIAELVIDEGEEVSDNPQANEDIAKLKKQIAAKRAELRDLEAKLKSIVAGMKGKKDGKVLKEIDLKGLKDLSIELMDEKDAKKLDEKIQIEIKNLKDRLNKDLKAAIQLEFMDEIGTKKLVEEIQKAIKADPNLKKLEELKKLGNIKDLEIKNLEDLKKLGNLNLELDVKNFDELKKLGDINVLKAKRLD